MFNLHNYGIIALEYAFSIYVVDRFEVIDCDPFIFGLYKYVFLEAMEFS